MFLKKWWKHEAALRGGTVGGGRGGVSLTLFQDQALLFLIFTRLRRDPAAGELGLRSIFGSAGTTSNFTRCRRRTQFPLKHERHRRRYGGFLNRCRTAFWQGAWLNQPVSYSLEDESLCAAWRSSGGPQRGGCRPLHMAATCTWVHTGHKQFN